MTELTIRLFSPAPREGICKLPVVLGEVRPHKESDVDLRCRLPLSWAADIEIFRAPDGLIDRMLRASAAPTA